MSDCRDCQPRGLCRRHKVISNREERAAREVQDIAWFNRSGGHCGGCGNPGAYCTCTETNPCGCRDLHDMGSARLADALESFMPTIVHVDQGELFGGSDA